jgi:hypothetical protein
MQLSIGNARAKLWSILDEIDRGFSLTCPNHRKNRYKGRFFGYSNQ